ncbi:hypothetical protein KIN20_011373 [Parelaphostrongylus tenuis]|uniref:Uncharacterized protein n=1 Tax=Parelaphostrongylus tenuis TaxID=148309 RepID=A0AAD5M9B0_PARTN|nr:hypothetical protein KIN20_011373 [Parelaphostrongylus tenuis]
MESLPTRLLMILMVTIAEVLCCGVMPPGQDPNIRTMVSGIAADKNSAQSLVSRLVMQTVFDILEQQGCSVFLPCETAEVEIPPRTVKRQLIRNRLCDRPCEANDCKVCPNGRDGDCMR